MINKIKTLKNLNKKFPRFQLETLLTIMDCIEDEINIFPIDTIANTNDTVLKPPFNPTCETSNRVCSTTDNYNQNSTLTATLPTPQVNNNSNYVGYCSMSETAPDGTVYKITAKNDNGHEEYHAYVNDEEVGMEFPPKSKKQPHLCDKTSCKVNILTEEEPKDTLDVFFEDNFYNDNGDEIFEKIIKQSYQ